MGAQVKIKRLPRTVPVGRGYAIRVALVTKSEMKQAVDDGNDDATPPDGLWAESLGEKYAGTIYIGQWLPMPQKWDTYWHEMIHVLNDIMAYDRETPVKT